MNRCWAICRLDRPSAASSATCRSALVSASGPVSAVRRGRAPAAKSSRLACSASGRHRCAGRGRGRGAADLRFAAASGPPQVGAESASVSASSYRAGVGPAADRLGQRLPGVVPSPRRSPQRDAERRGGAGLAGERELLTGERGRLFRVAERACAAAAAVRQDATPGLSMPRARQPRPPRADRRALAGRCCATRSAPRACRNRTVWIQPPGLATRGDHGGGLASSRRPRQVSASTQKAAAQATASGGEVASLKSRPAGRRRRRPRDAEPAHDHRAQAAGVGDHAHRTPRRGRRPGPHRRCGRRWQVRRSRSGPAARAPR